MFKEYVKLDLNEDPKLAEDPKIKMILEQHADKILNIINQEEITYDDFKQLVKNVFKSSENILEEGTFSYERELQQLYDEYRLFKRFVSNEERAQKIIKALLEFSKAKRN